MKYPERRIPDGLGPKQPGGLRGDLPRDLARHMQTFGPAAVAAVGRRVERPTDRRATRALGTVRSAYPPGVSKARDALGGPEPRAPCARCVQRPARKARRAGDARLRAATSLPPQLPGTLSARGRERAELGSGVRGAGWADRWAEGSRRPGRLLVLAAVSCGKNYRAPGAALPFGSWAESHPRGAVGTPSLRGEAGTWLLRRQAPAWGTAKQRFAASRNSGRIWGSVCFGFFQRPDLAGAVRSRGSSRLARQWGPPRAQAPPSLPYLFLGHILPPS